MASAAQRRVRSAFKRASKTCHAETSSPDAFGRCVKREMRGVGRKKTKKGPSIGKQCKGLYASGSKKGKLKSGYTWKGHRGRCPRKVA